MTTRDTEDKSCDTEVMLIVNLDLYADIETELEANAAEVRAIPRKLKLAVGLVSVPLQATRTVREHLGWISKVAASGDGNFRIENAATNSACKPAVFISMAAAVNKLCCKFQVSNLANTQLRKTHKALFCGHEPRAVTFAPGTTLNDSMWQLRIFRSLESKAWIAL
ncbi:hypothetical protein MRX96_050457 [Rhipicephalus microplus]